MGDDIEQIKILKARYFRTMDTKDWEGLARVFTDDVEIDVTGEGGGKTHGVGEYIPFLRAPIETVTTVYHGHMPEIEVTSPTTATASGPWRTSCGGPLAARSLICTASGTTTKRTRRPRRAGASNR
jgi:hypothetical protein